MKKISFTKAEIAVIRAGLEMYGNHRPVEKKFCDSAADKIALAELSMSDVGRGHATAHDAIIAMESVLGKGSMAIPPHAPSSWWARIGARIKSLGLTVGDFRKMATAIERKGWRPPYSFEKSVWGADRLITEAGMDSTDTPSTTYRAPLSLDDL